MATTIVSGQTPKTRPEIGAFYPALDGLRAVAFLLVFSTHFLKTDWTFCGVNFFLVLSGFLITGILWDGQDKPGKVTTFYKRRALRIFPLYYGVLLALWALTPVYRWEWTRAWIAWPLYLGNWLYVWHGLHPGATSLNAMTAQLISGRPTPYLQRLYLGHFWSLCLEEQFYLVWPAIVWKVRSRTRLLGTAIFVVVLCPMLRALLLRYTTNERDFISAGSACLQFDGLLLGACLALLWRGDQRQILQASAKVILAPLSVAAIVFAIAASHGSIHNLQAGRSFSPRNVWWVLSVFDLYGAALLLRSLDPGSSIYKLFSWQPLRWVGRVSYGAYVFHDIPQNLYVYLTSLFARRYPFLADHFSATTATIALAGTLALAAVSYATLEKYFLNLKNRVAPT